MAHKKDINEEKLVPKRDLPFNHSWSKKGSIDQQRHGIPNAFSVTSLEDGDNTDKIRPGCISKRLECTHKVNDCRTFAHETVAKLFCKCSQICSDVSRTNLATGNSGVHETVYHMGCSFTQSKHKNSSQKSSAENNQVSSMVSKVTSLVTKKPPIYCQFIPFFSYWRKFIFDERNAWILYMTQIQDFYWLNAVFCIVYKQYLTPTRYFYISEMCIV